MGEGAKRMRGFMIGGKRVVIIGFSSYRTIVNKYDLLGLAYSVDGLVIQTSALAVLANRLASWK